MFFIVLDKYLHQKDNNEDISKSKFNHFYQIFLPKFIISIIYMCVYI